MDLKYPDFGEERWPIDYVEEFRRRSRLLVHLRKHPHFLAALKKIYADEPWRFIEDWLFTYDPRVNPSWMPFMLFKRQKEYIYWLHQHYRHKEDGLVEKCRDAGLTWLNVGYSIYLWLFESAKIGWGSRKQDLVDRMGDMDSIFEKIRQSIRKLPLELLPPGFRPNDHMGFNKIFNPATGSAITGEAGENIGRGGRSSIYMLDEAAFLSRPLVVDAALSQNSDVKMHVSTPNGVGNPFYKKRFSGNLDVFVFDWRDDPRKTQQWYDKQVRTLDAITVAQEIDRDYGASLDGVLIPSKWVLAARKAFESGRITAEGDLYAGLDVADEGSDSNALAFRQGPVVVAPVEVWNKGNTAQTTARAALRCRERHCRNLRFDVIGVGAGVKAETAKDAYEDLDVMSFDSRGRPSLGFYVKPRGKVRGRKNRDMFRNFRAEAWWKLRRRFENTYKLLNDDTYIPDPDDEFIAIAIEDSQLMTELSQPTYELDSNGKILVESKEAMSRRGVQSPNRADALVMAFAPPQKKKGGAW